MSAAADPGAAHSAMPMVVERETTSVERRQVTARPSRPASSMTCTVPGGRSARRARQSWSACRHLHAPRQPWTCVVTNLHVDHTAAGVAAAGEAFRAFYDLALARGGSFYLAYGRHTHRD